MVLDPRTPVIVGTGQVLDRPVRDGGPTHRREPLDLMVAALLCAAEDVEGVSPGAPTPKGRALLEKIDQLASVASFTWRAPNPSLLVAERLGLSPRELVLSATGGTMPQKLLSHGAASIASGEIDVVAIVGSEAMYSRGMVKKDPLHPHAAWTRQDPDATPRPIVYGVERPPLTEFEISRGIFAPVEIYPLFENALRSRRGGSIREHRQQLGALWSSFSNVASSNENAWIRAPHTTEEIITPTSTNRYIAEPYTKLMVANLPVDMGAALLLCSLEMAQRLGLDEDRFVFPQSHAFADEHFFISDRIDLDRSAALRAAGVEVFAHTNTSINDVAHIDLYSCFPVAVEMGAEALGLPLNDESRLLTVTGGLTFGGGPGNNYVSHSISAMTNRLREHPGDFGLVTGLSYFASSHSVALYGATPPATPFRSVDVQAIVDATPKQKTDPALHGEVTIETYTVIYDRDGAPTRVTAAVKDARGSRSWALMTDPSALREVVGTELLGRSAVLSADGTLALV